MLRATVITTFISLVATTAAAQTLKVKWESEASAGKFQFLGTVKLADKLDKGVEAHIEVHRTGESPEKQEASVKLKKKSKKLKWHVKGAGEGSYQVRVWFDVDGNGELNAGDLDGWYAKSAEDPVVTADGATAIELVKKKKIKKLDFALAAVAEGGAAGEGESDGAAGEGGDAAEGGETAAAESGSAPATEKPAWVGGHSGPWKEGEARWIVGINFRATAEAEEAKKKARAALVDKNGDFAMLLGNQYSTSMEEAGTKVGGDEVDAVTAAWNKACSELDAEEEWASPEGEHHARARTELSKVLARIAGDTSVAEPLRTWMAGNVGSVHEIFVQLEQ